LLLTHLLGGVGVGLIGGITSGLLGVSPGGGLVVFSVILLGVDQHVAQGISLIAQVPPTGLAGIRRYRRTGQQAPLSWLALLTIGFVIGGIFGALVAGKTSNTTLQWIYVGYLSALDAIMLLQRQHREHAERHNARSGWTQWMGLIVVGVAGGFSSGLLGIGGGLAITVGLTVGLKISRHQAQLVSLMLALAPMTIPAAYIYWQQGRSGSWSTVCGVILGLWGGTDIGARLAIRVSEGALNWCAIGFVSIMALYMAGKALS
jgi:uncharacterized protein